MIVKNEGELVAMGEEVGKALETKAVLLLVGDLGTGKTTFTRGVARGLGASGEVTSPSFVIEKTYETPKGVLRHFDLYRFGEDLGIIRETLREALEDEKGITVVEWGEEAKDILPERAKIWRFAVTPDGGREVVEL